jgi:nucleoside-diphosphate-sugar epimerase
MLAREARRGRAGECGSEENAMSGEQVLVTGGSGFIGSRCILSLLDGGYRVRTTVRSLQREVEVRDTLRAGGAADADGVAFAAADLMSDDGWAEAVEGCDHILHVASPFPNDVPKHEDELIVPARDGALRVLRAARDAGVKRVVLTSSFAAIGYGHPPSEQTFTEESWTDLDGRGVSAYVKSKTVAERAAWDFVEAEGGDLELAVINPVGVFGPVLGADYSTSIGLVRRLVGGEMPGVPQMSFGAVDVRDVADLHISAMTNPAARGERFLATAGDFMTIKEMADVLRDRLGDAGRRVPTRVLPNLVVRAASLFDAPVRQIVPELGTRKNGSSEKARRLLGWQPRSREDAIVATAESLLALGLVRGAPAAA